MKIPKTLEHFTLSTNDKIIYSSDHVKRLWIESPNLTINKIDNCEELYFSGDAISSKDILAVDNIKLATVNLNDIKIGNNLKRLSITKSNLKKIINDNIIIFHCSKSGAVEFRSNNLKVIRIDDYTAPTNEKNLILRFKSFKSFNT